MKHKFQELYYLESIDSENFTSEMEENFVFSGRNWGFYFTKLVNSECEKIENVKFVKWDFSKKDSKWIDYDSELDLNLIYSTND